MVYALAGGVFVLGYAAIALEHKLHVNKSAVALIIGGILWVLAIFFGGEHAKEEVAHAGSEIFGIVAFLLAAMSLVEILSHYRFFDLVRGRLFALGLTNRKQFVAITGISFFLSAILDNLTTTIVMVTIAQRFFREKNLLLAVAAIVIAANAGGAFSPIGDVTTIMLWLAGKFSATEVVIDGFLPSIVMYLVPLAFMLRQIDDRNGDDAPEEIVTQLVPSEKLVITLAFASFGLPLLFSLMGLPPYIGLLSGLGVVWLLIDYLKRAAPYETHLEAQIDEMIKKIDIPSLAFFIGILLAVSGMGALGMLEGLSHQIYGESPSLTRVVGGNVLLGFLSAILDNVPLTAMAIQMLPVTDPAIWVLLALTAGTGGSMLVIGSAAGVVAMGMVKELNFHAYLKIASFPAMLGFLAGVLVWYAQYTLL